MGSRFVTSAFLFITIFLSTKIYASPLTNLLDSPNRPTMLQVAEAMNWDFTSNPSFAEPSTILPHQIKKTLLQRGVPMLVALEYAFPGATWAPLGRDVVVNGDFLDAFYLLRGQKERVIRINASGPSFKSSVPLIDLFKTLKLVDEQGIPTKSFVIFDYTTYRPLSQSTQLIKEIYKYIPAEQHTDFLSKVNLLTMYEENFRGVFPALDLGQFWSRVQITQGRPQTILKVPNIGTYFDFWHESFGPFQYSEDKTVFTKPGAPASLSMRITILRTMIEIFRIVGSDDFLNKLNTYAKSVYHLDMNHWLEGDTLGPINKINTIEDLKLFIATTERKKIDLNGRDQALLTSNLPTLASWQLELDTIQNFAAILRSVDRQKFIALRIREAPSMKQALELLNISSLQPFERKRLIRENLNSLLQGNSTLAELNQLIDLIPKNSKLHSEIAAAAVKLTSTLEEYKSITRPTYFGRTSIFRKAKSDFQKAQRPL